MIDDDMGCADHCSREIVGVGWREYQGRWLPLDACAEHLGQLDPKPDRRNRR